MQKKLVLFNLKNAIESKVFDVESNTFCNTIHSKGLKKLAILLDHKRPWMLCLALRPHQKVPKSDLQNEFSMSKIIQIFLISFH